MLEFLIWPSLVAGAYVLKVRDMLRVPKPSPAWVPVVEPVMALEPQEAAEPEPRIVYIDRPVYIERPERPPVRHVVYGSTTVYSERDAPRRSW